MTLMIFTGWLEHVLLTAADLSKEVDGLTAADSDLLLAKT